VEQLLGVLPVVHRDQQVSDVAEGLAGLAQRLVEPTAAVEADVEGAGEPALQAPVAEADLGVVEVGVVVQAPAGLLAQLEAAVLVLARAVGGAGLDAGQQGQAAAAAAVRVGEWACAGLLVGVGAVAVAQGDAVGVSVGLGQAAQAPGEVLGVGGKILGHAALRPEVAVHAGGVVEQPGVAAEAQAVESRQDGEDEGSETCEKGLHGVLLGARVGGTTTRPKSTPLCLDWVAGAARPECAARIYGHCTGCVAPAPSTVSRRCRPALTRWS